MCFIFDAFTPARQFKRGTLYKENLDFADYGPEPWDDLTDTDTAPPGWLPYKPEAYEYVVYHPLLPFLFLYINHHPDPNFISKHLCHKASS